jgi:hypothetical protein
MEIPIIVCFCWGGHMPKGRTLPSKQRTHLLRAYRSRGRANRNIWLVYSPKTDRDWILNSDRHLVHWVIFLETDPDVHSFDIETVEEESGNRKLHQGPDYDADVTLADGKHEYHKIVSTRNLEFKADCIASGAVELSNASLRVFSETDLQPRGEEAMRWLKVLCYCAGIRAEKQSDATVAVITVMQGLGRGTVSDVLALLQDFDVQISVSIVSRLAVLGDISLDLSSKGFTLLSQWEWRTRK